jgi:hypothetical protein
MKKTLLAFLGAGVLILFIGAVLIWFWLIRELPALDASISLPSETELGSTISMTITANNPHDKPVVLDSIDIDDSFLTGFQVVSIDPKSSNTTHVFGQRSWDFGQSVPSGKSMVVRFELKAVQQGRFSGDVDVCNPNQDSKSLLADVIVKESVPSHKTEDTGAKVAEPTP